jgi:polyisoprenoid-binding protein YceI
VIVAAIVNPAAYGQSNFNPDPSAVHAGNYELDPLHSKITWTTSHFGLSRYNGQLADVTGRLNIDPKQPERTTLQVTLPMDKGGTFQSNLDERLRTEFFDIGTYPTATFSSTRIAPAGERQVRVTGNLTLKGTTKPVTFDATFNAAGIHPVSKRHTIGIQRRDVHQALGIRHYRAAASDWGRRAA